jgi:serine/threonine-protein kinase RsbT
VLDDTTTEARIALFDEDDVVRARQTARDVAKALGFGLVDQSRIATAVSELTRNVLQYATNSRGDVMIHTLTSRQGVGIEIVVADEGPGIPDVQLAGREGYSSGTGMGMGLPGARRLMDELEIDTSPGRGTTVTIRKWRR